VLAIEALITVESLGMREPQPQLGAGIWVAYAAVRAAAAAAALDVALTGVLHLS
jgi:hypothetical protein